MTNINLISENDLLKFRDYLEITKKSLGVRRQKTRAILGAVMGLVCVGGGVAITVLFPNPITIAVLGGLSVLSNRRNPKRVFKNIQDKTKQKDTIIRWLLIAN